MLAATCLAAGQVRDVVVYRLMTCGTIEDRIYRKQVAAGSIVSSAPGVRCCMHSFSLYTAGFKLACPSLLILVGALLTALVLQVFKGGLSRSGTEAGTQFRYFSQQVGGHTSEEVGPPQGSVSSCRLFSA